MGIHSPTLLLVPLTSPQELSIGLEDPKPTCVLTRRGGFSHKLVLGWANPTKSSSWGSLRYILFRCSLPSITLFERPGTLYCLLPFWLKTLPVSFAPSLLFPPLLLYPHLPQLISRAPPCEVPPCGVQQRHPGQSLTSGTCHSSPDVRHLRWGSTRPTSLLVP